MQRSIGTGPKNLGALGRLGWLAEQPDAFRNSMMAAGRWVTVGAGKSIYAVGDEADALYGLESGLLDVAIAVSPHEQVTVDRATAGFWIGDSAVLSRMPRSLSIVAATKCRLLRIPGTALHLHLAENPADWRCFYMLNHLNGTRAVRALAEALSLSPRVRFARTLLRLADEDGVVRITQEELSRMVGMNRASFRRAFAELIGNGVLRTSYGRLHILDRAVLEHEAQLPGEQRSRTTAAL